MLKSYAEGVKKLLGWKRKKKKRKIFGIKRERGREREGGRRIKGDQIASLEVAPFHMPRAHATPSCFCMYFLRVVHALEVWHSPHYVICVAIPLPFREPRRGR